MSWYDLTQATALNTHKTDYTEDIILKGISASKTVKLVELWLTDQVCNF